MRNGRIAAWTDKGKCQPDFIVFDPVTWFGGNAIFKLNKIVALKMYWLNLVLRVDIMFNNQVNYLQCNL